MKELFADFKDAEIELHNKYNSHSLDKSIKRLYKSTGNNETILKALHLAYIIHEKQFRKEKENHRNKPYLIHPVSVAAFLSEQKNDIETIVAGLLHDIKEKSNTIETKLLISELIGIYGNENAGEEFIDWYFKIPADISIRAILNYQLPFFVTFSFPDIFISAVDNYYYKLKNKSVPEALYETIGEYNNIQIPRFIQMQQGNTIALDELANRPDERETLIKISKNDIINFFLPRIFNPDTALLIEACTSQQKFDYLNDKISEKTEFLIKMAFYSLYDDRIMVVKSADRFDNLQSFGVYNRKQQERILKESYLFYLPLIKNKGIHNKMKFLIKKLSEEYNIETKDINEMLIEYNKADTEKMKSAKKTLQSFMDYYSKRTIKIMSSIARNYMHFLTGEYIIRNKEDVYLSPLKKLMEGKTINEEILEKIASYAIPLILANGSY